MKEFLACYDSFLELLFCFTFVIVFDFVFQQCLFLFIWSSLNVTLIEG
jgi:hypothetical protein